MSALPEEVQVVIIGGGIGGASIAYHLAKRGVSDVLLLERGQLTCGTTWHAAGLVGTLWPTKNMTQLGAYSHRLYQELEAETGQATGYKRNGSISLAQTTARLEELTRTAEMARVFGVEVDVVGPKTLGELYPGIDTRDIVGGLHLPKDGQTNPIDVTMALAKGARMNGATVREGVTVTKILTDGDKVTGVETTQGTVRAKKVVLTGGMWSRDLAKQVGVVLPLFACEHYYVVTDAIPGLPKNLPIMRDLDHGVYFKEDAGKLLIGFFEDNANPLPMSKVPADFSFGELPYEFDHFEKYLERAMIRYPALENVGIPTFFNGPESFTTDNQHLMGEAPLLKNFFVACGFNSRGIGGAGGIGKVMAEWIDLGYPPVDVWESDCRRAMPFQGDETYLENRVAEALERSYAMHWPYYQYRSSRGIRKSPFYDRLVQLGAVHGEVAGWERPNWYAPEGVKPEYEYSYGRQNWFQYSAQEHLNVRENVGFYDLTSLAKFKVTGSDAETLLQRLCCADVAVPVGKLVYTQWLNERGGIEADLTISKMGDDEFLITTPCGSHVKDWSWLHRHAGKGHDVKIEDVTDDYGVIALQGPNARKVFQTLTDADLSNEAFAFGTGRWIKCGGVELWAQRISYVGELGWEIFIPRGNALRFLDALLDAGKSFGLRPLGMHAVDALRMEKAFRHWGHDVVYEDNLVDAGLAFTAKPEKNVEFIGREAFLQQKAGGVSKKRMISFLLEDPDPLLFHNEPILMNGKAVGYLTSGNYAHHLGAAIGMGYVSADEPLTADLLAKSQFAIQVNGKAQPAKASLKPFFDPTSARMRA
ncbi:glycine-cleavage system T/FAD dependent oxidoreductase domain-containing protein [Rhizobium sp. NXC24]|nr:glycine-cleavage system T/FAD dependent oxidoreductase domain-containing protein [Rhizobium sp. NXC24]